jgi:hypothetical protein
MSKTNEPQTYPFNWREFHDWKNKTMAPDSDVHLVVISSGSNGRVRRYFGPDSAGAIYVCSERSDRGVQAADQ